MYIDFKLLGKRIAQRKRELGYKQCELAEKADLSNNYLSSIERGWSIPSMTTFAAICVSLETSPDYFLLGTIKASDVPHHIIDGLKLCSEDDLVIIDGLIQVLINKNSKGKL